MKASVGRRVKGALPGGAPAGLSSWVGRRSVNGLPVVYWNLENAMARPDKRESQIHEQILQR
jgi:hypothetical protein